MPYKQSELEACESFARRVMSRARILRAGGIPLENVTPDALREELTHMKRHVVAGDPATVDFRPLPSGLIHRHD